MITALYAALLAFILIGLTLRVIKGRHRYKVPLGDGGEYALQQRMRAHANFIEYTPFFLILLVLVEYQGLPAYGIHALGSVFVLGRIIHAYGLGFAEKLEDGKFKNGQYRVRGMACTALTIAVAASILLIQLFLQLF